ncbi:MAG: hypothetical protein E7371_00220 [Clostridiales bacterium]|nr:hypothetical protein [Clostridiales bacterium]
MKKSFYLFGGLLLISFALLCFFEFFFAWNACGVMELRFKNDNLSVDLYLSFPVTEAFTMRGSHNLSFDEMVQYFLSSSAVGNRALISFTREEYLQLFIFLILGVTLMLKSFGAISKKALGMAFLALTILALWVTMKDFIEQWRYMFKEEGRFPGWKNYRFGDGATTSKFLVFLCMCLHAGQNMLLAVAFGVMAAVLMMPGMKGLAIIPAVIAGLYAGLMFVCNLTGWGFAVAWGDTRMTPVIIFLIVDVLLMLGLYFTGSAIKSE